MARAGCYAVILLLCSVAIISIDAEGSEVIAAIIIMMFIKTCSLRVRGQPI